MLIFHLSLLPRSFPSFHMTTLTLNEFKRLWTTKNCKKTKRERKKTWKWNLKRIFRCAQNFYASHRCLLICLPISEMHEKNRRVSQSANRKEHVHFAYSFRLKYNKKKDDYVSWRRIFSSFFSCVLLVCVVII